MKSKISMVAGMLLLSACGDQTSPEEARQIIDITTPTAAEYVILDDSLQQLKDDFNAAAGKVRLVFISGPTCGICLRGMADLNDEFLAAAQNDKRLQTFVIHVPTLGAREEHVPDSIPLLDGPNVRHYWEESGIIGSRYQETMDVPMYVWDFWSIYGPDALWQEINPPMPDYYEHQLGWTTGKSQGFPREKLLDKVRFAAETEQYLANLPEIHPDQQDNPLQSSTDLYTDGLVIPVVAQPRGFAIQTHIVGRGRYQNLKMLQSVVFKGSIEFAGQTYPLSIKTSRGDSIQRVIDHEHRHSTAGKTNGRVVMPNPATARGLPAELELLLLTAFDFDGALVEWPSKGHQTEMLGMEKIGNVLAWKLDLLERDGNHWHLFIDSRGGGIVKASLLDENDQPRYTILQSDYRKTSGYSFAHRVEYQDAAGKLLATEYLETVVVTTDHFDISTEPINH